MIINDNKQPYKSFWPPVPLWTAFSLGLLVAQLLPQYFLYNSLKNLSPLYWSQIPFLSYVQLSCFNRPAHAVFS